MRQCFLRFFAILLAILAAFLISLRMGAPQLVWRMDQSMMTSAIALLFVIAVARIGAASWSATEVTDGELVEPELRRSSTPAEVPFDKLRARDLGYRAAFEFGHLCIRLSVMLGFIGTAMGLSLQAHALATDGAASLGALSTSLFTTATGGVAAALLEIVTHNLEVEVSGDA